VVLIIIKIMKNLLSPILKLNRVINRIRCIFYIIWMIMSTVFLSTLYTCSCRIGMIPYMDMVRLMNFVCKLKPESNESLKIARLCNPIVCSGLFLK
jgi:hypothetical protein